MLTERKLTADGQAYWLATRSYTATCPEGKSGVPVTKTRSGSSFLSADDAARIARARAKRDAECELQCGYQATASYTGTCGYTATETGTDPCSPVLAQEKAMAAARDSATYFCVYGHAR